MKNCVDGRATHEIEVRDNKQLYPLSMKDLLKTKKAGVQSLLENTAMLSDELEQWNMTGIDSFRLTSHLFVFLILRRISS